MEFIEGYFRNLLLITESNMYSFKKKIHISFIVIMMNYKTHILFF